MAVGLLAMLVHFSPVQARPITDQPPLKLRTVAVPKAIRPAKEVKLKPLAKTFESKPIPKATSGNPEDIVRMAARKYGIDEGRFVRMGRCESGLDPMNVNRNYYENGNPSGIFQHVSGYWPGRAAKYGHAGSSVFDAKANAEVTAQMVRDGLSHLWECPF